MPTIKIPKGGLDPKPAFQPGVIQVRFSGFKPEKARKGNSVNLNPVMMIVNDNRTFPDGRPYNGQMVFCNLNETFYQELLDFFHCFGEMMPEDKNGDRPFPGSWGNGAATNDAEPRMWGPYSGLIVNQIGTLELAEVPVNVKQGDGSYAPDPTRTRSDIKRFICNVPNCHDKHSENLIR